MVMYLSMIPSKLGKLESNLYQAKTIHSNLEVFIAELSSRSVDISSSLLVQGGSPSSHALRLGDPGFDHAHLG